MIKVKVVLYKQKTLKDDTHPVMLRLTNKGVLKYVSLGKSCKPEQWEKSTSSFIRNYPNAVRWNTFIREKLTEAENIIRDLERRGKPYTIVDAQRLIKSEGASAKFYEFTTQEIQKMNMAKQVGNALIYQTAMNAVKDFREQDFTFEEMDYRMLTDLEAHFRSKGNRVNTISNYMRTIRAIYNKAIKAGLASKELYPFSQYKVKYEDPAKRAISKEDLKKIIDTELTDGSSVWHARNLFLFSFYTMGMNWTDMVMLKLSDISNGRIFYKRAKTGREYTIKISPPTQQILDHYTQGKTSNDYVFPVVTRDHDPQLLRRDIRYKLKNVNKWMQKLANQVGVQANLTTYVARHTWATLANRSNVNIGIISEGLGHQNIKTTQTYLKAFGSEELDKANEIITNI
jgi:integrase